MSWFRIFPRHGPDVRYNEEIEQARVNCFFFFFFFLKAYNEMDIRDIQSLFKLEERTIEWNEAVRQANKKSLQVELEFVVEYSEVTAERAYAVAAFALRYGIATDEKKKNRIGSIQSFYGKNKCLFGHEICAFLSGLTLGVSQTFNEKVKNVVIDGMRKNPQILMDAMGERDIQEA
jgi:hypothetical protein